MKLDRVNRILKNGLYNEYLQKIQAAEIDRIYCRHDMVHFLDVARIGCIIARDEKIDISDEMIYAAAILHDIGRWVQYLDETAHELAGAMLAPAILAEAGFNEAESDIIVNAIREHGNETIAQQRNLMGVLYRADKLSRKCFACNAADTCHKASEKRNMELKI